MGIINSKKAAHGLAIFSPWLISERGGEREGFLCIKYLKRDNEKKKRINESLILNEADLKNVGNAKRAKILFLFL